MIDDPPTIDVDTPITISLTLHELTALAAWLNQWAMNGIGDAQAIIEGTLWDVDPFSMLYVRYRTDHDRNHYFYETSYRYSRYGQLVESGVNDPSLGDVAEYELSHARADWREHRVGYLELRRYMMDLLADEYATFEALRCQATTRAGLRCRNDVRGCRVHDQVPGR
jgi:hypothetical protein